MTKIATQIEHANRLTLTDAPRTKATLRGWAPARRREARAKRDERARRFERAIESNYALASTTLVRRAGLVVAVYTHHPHVVDGVLALDHSGASVSRREDGDSIILAFAF